jgi:hypothetical protein
VGNDFSNSFLQKKNSKDEISTTTSSALRGSSKFQRPQHPVGPIGGSCRPCQQRYRSHHSGIPMSHFLASSSGRAQAKRKSWIFSLFKMGKIAKMWLLKVTKRSPELSGKVALRIQVGKRFKGDNPTTSEVKSTTILLIVFVRPLLVHHVTSGQTTWENIKQGSPCISCSPF